MIRRIYTRLQRLFRRRRMTYAETIRSMEPTAYYPLSGMDGERVIDRSGHGHDARIVRESKHE